MCKKYQCISLFPQKHYLSQFTQNINSIQKIIENFCEDYKLKIFDLQIHEDYLDVTIQFYCQFEMNSFLELFQEETSHRIFSKLMHDNKKDFWCSYSGMDYENMSDYDKITALSYQQMDTKDCQQICFFDDTYH